MSRRRKTASSVPHHQFKKLSEETLAEMRTARQKADLAAAEAQNLQSSYRLMIAKQLDKINMPIQSSSICMTCGTVRPANIQCPECQTP